MPEVYTSYYNNPGLKDRGDLVCLQVSRTRMRFGAKTVGTVEIVTPTEAELTTGQTDGTAAQLDMMRTRLLGAGVPAIMAAIRSAVSEHPGKTPVLLCHEGPKKPDCHRHLVRNILRAGGIDCAEF